MTKLVTIPLYEFSDVLQENTWYDSLIMCPSQCYYHVVDDGLHYILYLRWRYDDPWHGYIIRGAANEKTMSNNLSSWSDNLFAMYGLEFREDQLSVAKDALLDLFLKYYRGGANE